MPKNLYIAEKPSVANEFAKVVGGNTKKYDGYLESDDSVITWCVGHLVTMSYPECYDAALKKWSKETLPFIPDEFKYEIIGSVKKQYKIVEGLLNRDDVERIYVCTDSGREGEYIYRLVDRMAKVPDTKDKRRVWIDSQTEDEIKRGINEAKPLSEYDNLSASAYLRAKEDYLMGINFSRILSITYGQTLNDYYKGKRWLAVSVGRVMTCVLGMIVERERAIRDFKKDPFYRVLGSFSAGIPQAESIQPKTTSEDGAQSGTLTQGTDTEGINRTGTTPDVLSDSVFIAEWKAVEGSAYYQTPFLYKENGFKERNEAEKLCERLNPEAPATVTQIEKKKEKKNPPLLFNLAELQNICSKLFKISPDQTLQITQELYEKKLVTYPRTDARVLSTAIAGEIHKNIKGLAGYELAAQYASDILERQAYKGIEKTKYVNDKQITDHYAIIPTGQGLGALNSMSDLGKKVYEVIVRRFLAIFYPAAVYQKIAVTIGTGEPAEYFFTSVKILVDPGFLPVSKYSFIKKKDKQNKDADRNDKTDNNDNADNDDDETAEDEIRQTMSDEELTRLFSNLKKGSALTLKAVNIKEGETSPPKRYNSGQMILAMENAGQLIEDEDLRAQIKGSGIGTSATRAEILKKLVNIQYINLNKKTQIYTPTLVGEAVYEIVTASIKSMLNPKLTASWELGLSQVAEGTITEQEYMDKLSGFIERNVEFVKNNVYIPYLRSRLDSLRQYYKR